MDTFKEIYRILRFLKHTMKLEEFPLEDFNSTYFKLSDVEFVNMIEMLAKREYIDGVSIRRGADGMIQLSISAPRITLFGLEYLEGNEFMLKTANEAKGITP